MSFISKAIAPWCMKYGSEDGVHGYHHAPATCIEGNVCNGNGDFVNFFPVAVSMEGDDDDDDGGYDYAPAA